MAFRSILRRASSSRPYFTVAAEAKGVVPIIGSIDAEMRISSFQRLINLESDPARHSRRMRSIRSGLSPSNSLLRFLRFRSRFEHLFRFLGLAIYNTLQLLRKRVDTVCVGTAASVGAVILAAGTKGYRWALPESKIVISELLTADGDEQSSERVLQQQQREAVTRILAKHTGQTVERVSECMQGDLCMDAGEALKFGLIDRLVPYAEDLNM